MNRNKKLPVVLWLDEDIPAPRAAVSAIAEALKKELSWLNPAVMVTSVSLAQKRPIQGLCATNLKRPKGTA